MEGEVSNMRTYLWPSVVPDVIFKYENAFLCFFQKVQPV